MPCSRRQENENKEMQRYTHPWIKMPQQNPKVRLLPSAPIQKRRHHHHCVCTPRPNHRLKHSNVLVFVTVPTQTRDSEKLSSQLFEKVKFTASPNKPGRKSTVAGARAHVCDWGKSRHDNDVLALPKSKPRVRERNKNLTSSTKNRRDLFRLFADLRNALALAPQQGRPV